MAKGYKHGTSGKKENPLNFQVKTYPSETEVKADTPKMNTVGICTTTTMKSWVFAPTEPTSPEVGMVWIKTVDSGENGFNALSKNEIHLIPGGAKQYESGAWADKVSFYYINGEWKEGAVVAGNVLYDVGNQYTDVTGGWGNTGWTSGVSGYTLKAPTIDDTGITLGFEQNKYTTVGTAKKIDLSKVKTLYVNISECPASFSGTFAVNSEMKVGTAPMYNMAASVATTGPGEFSLDVSSINEGYVVFFASIYAGAAIKITKIRME